MRICLYSACRVATLLWKSLKIIFFRFGRAWKALEKLLGLESFVI